MFKKYIEMMRAKRHNSSKKTLFLYYFLRLLVIVSLVREIFTHSYFNAFLCVLTLVLFTLPTFIEEELKINLPNTLEAIIYLFIFAAEILGELNNFYQIIPIWDTMLHTVNGFLCAGVGFSLFELINRNSKNIQLSPWYLTIVAFCFSMMVGACWEIFEYSCDNILKTDMQKDTYVTSITSVSLHEEGLNVPVTMSGIQSVEIHFEDGTVYVLEDGYLDIGLRDTMDDMIVNLVGAVTFSIFGYLYEKYKDENNTIAAKFIPTAK